MKRTAFFLAAWIAMGVAAGAAAQTPPPAEREPEITVTAHDKVNRAEAQHFARKVAPPTPSTDQLARFHMPACPMALGFTPHFAEAIVARMREDVTLVHAPLDQPGCKGNMLVIATGNATALLQDAQKNRSALLDGVDDSVLRQLLASHDPVRAWTVTRVLSEDGDPIDRRFGDGMVGATVRQPSRLHHPTQRVLLFSVVLIEQPALVDKSSAQIADYAAMRGLAETRPSDGEGRFGTILSLFAPGGAPPREMSDADLTYLISLYRQPTFTDFGHQIGAIASDVQKTGK